MNERHVVLQQRRRRCPRIIDERVGRAIRWPLLPFVTFIRPIPRRLRPRENESDGRSHCSEREDEDDHVY